MDPRVTMLMCSERSGSNLISRMMGAHPDVCSPAPSHLIRVLAENRVRYGDLDEDANWERLLTDAVDLLASQLGHWRCTWTTGELESRVTDRSLRALVRHLFFSEAAAAGCGRLFIKENHIYRYLPFLQRAFPGLQIVYLVRDPRDMALSWKNSPILRGDVVRAARIWREDQWCGLQLMGFLDQGTDIHQLSYESLVSGSSRELESICEFLGLRPDESMVEFHRRGESVSASTCTDDWKNLERPVMRANFGKWRDGLSSDEAGLVEAVCGDVMEAFGYPCELGADLDLTALETQLLPKERHEKPGWALVPEAEKAKRQKRAEVLARIVSHRIQRPVERGVLHV